MPSPTDDVTPDPTSGLSEEHADIFHAYQLFVDEEAGWTELDAALRLSHVLNFLEWVEQDDGAGDPFADAEGRDRAVGYYKRFLFQQGRQPIKINAVLATLVHLFGWSGLGPHQVPFLEGAFTDAPQPPHAAVEGDDG